MEASQPIGREDDVAAILAALAADACVVVEGEPGIGKTSVLRSALEQCRLRLAWSVTCHEAERDLGLAVLADLLDSMPSSAYASLSSELRRVADIVLFRDAPAGDPVDSRALGEVTLAALRAVSEDEPVVVAVDDLQWCDRSSLKALAFALRRIEQREVSVLATRRPAHEAPMPNEALFVLGPLAGEPLRALIRRSASGPLPPGAVEDIVRRSGGNPFYAVELAHDRARPDGADRRVSSLSALLSRQIAAVPVEEQPALRYLAVCGEAGSDEMDPDGLPYSLGARLVAARDGRLAFRHPLLASAALEQATAVQLRSAHDRAARVARDPVERALHRARSGIGSEKVGSELDAATDLALARGDLDGARTLAQLAVEHGRTEGRLVTLAELEAELGATATAATLARELLASATTAPARNRALRILAWSQDNAAVADELLAEAAELSGLSQELRLATRAQRAHVHRIMTQPREAQLDLEAILDEAREGTPTWATAAAHECVNRRLLGRSVDGDRLSRAVEIDRTLGCDWPSLALSDAAVIAYFDDRHDEARQLMAEAESLALRNGGFPSTGVYTAALDRRTGQLASAEAKLLRFLDRKAGVDRTPALLELAHVNAWQGRSDEAQTRVREAFALQGSLPPRDPARGEFIAGFVHVLDGRPHEGWDHLCRAVDHLRVRGIAEPSFVPALPAAVEVAAACGKLSEAASLLDQLENQSHALCSRWGLAAAEAGHGYLAGARGETDDAERHFASAIHLFEELRLPLEAGRVQLALGSLLRRTRRRRQAQELLQRVIGTFTSCGASGLAVQAEQELARTGVLGRAASTALTPSERLVAELAARGMRNTDVAVQMHLSVKTVEAHLGRVYRKLQVRNRTELAGRLASPDWQQPGS
ncbi:LuxR family transcriptional regulator [Jatrophihabitans telluris]|uniref:LuxR family transcriptional regulator n=1 Tax=Jatrophihabitans telluris TaxID=2038343 RepID=A0ABY4R3B9_9ACTN|nr:LuxR family transcriptional regulator [Jatrophihabitans telluris]UQX90320.1 LuxR family transcriptional regulator [Jatrophihabitans telluris]